MMGQSFRIVLVGRRRRRRLRCFLVAASSMLAAQAAAAAGAAAATRSRGGRFRKVQLTAGRSTVLSTEFDVTRIADHQPGDRRRRRRAAARDADRRQEAGHGQPDRLGRRVAHAVQHGRRAADHDARAAAARALPRRRHAVGTNEGATILSGRVSSTNVMLRMGEIAAASMPKAQVINLLQVPGGSESQQVMLQVRFAEVNRRKLTEAGLDAVRAHGQTCSARSTTQQFAAPNFDDDDGEDELVVQRFPEPLLLRSQARHRRRPEGACKQTGGIPEPRRAEPDCLQRSGGQLPGRRRVPGSGGAGHRRTRSPSCSRSSASV